MKKRRLRATRDASFSVTTFSLVCVSRPNHHQLTRNIPLASTNFEASPECLLERVSYCNSAYDNDRWLTIFLHIAGFVRPKFRKNQIAQLLSKVTVNCAPLTQLTLLLQPRHYDSNIFPMSQSPKYNLGAGWAGHRIKRTGWENSMGLTGELRSSSSLSICAESHAIFQNAKQTQELKAD